MDACRSRTNAYDRLPLVSLGPVEGGDGIVESRDVADVRPQSSVPHPQDDRTQLGAIGLDNEVDHQAVGGPRLWRPADGHQCSSGSNQACGPLPDVAADDIEHQILATPSQYLFLVYCSVEKLMHQRPNPIHFFFQREMARIEKMELCAGNISFKEFSTLHREDSIVFAPRDQRRGLMFAEVLLPIVENIQISLRIVEN